MTDDHLYVRGRVEARFEGQSASQLLRELAERRHECLDWAVRYLAAAIAHEGRPDLPVRHDGVNVLVRRADGLCAPFKIPGHLVFALRGSYLARIVIGHLDGEWQS